VAFKAHKQSLVRLINIIFGPFRLFPIISSYTQTWNTLELRQSQCKSWWNTLEAVSMQVFKLLRKQVLKNEPEYVYVDHKDERALPFWHSVTQESRISCNCFSTSSMGWQASITCIKPVERKGKTKGLA
jgi:hypothetical protein